MMYKITYTTKFKKQRKLLKSRKYNISLLDEVDAPSTGIPAASKKRGEQGEVLLKVEVLANGSIGRAEVEKSSGSAALDEAALATVKRWRFKPAMKGRETVICWVNIPIKFSLN